MADIAKYIRELEQEKEELAGKLQKVEQVLIALRNVGGAATRTARKSTRASVGGDKRTGQVRSEETKAKMRAAQQKRWADKKKAASGAATPGLSSGEGDANLVDPKSASV